MKNEGKGHKTVFKVSGMSCQHCVASVRGALITLPGVKGVDVNPKDGTTTVEHDPGQTEIGVMKKAIEEAGYSVES
jgi:copper chaperone